MRIFDRLRALRAFEKQHLDFLETLEDQNLVREIGYHEAQGIPLSLKRLFLLDIGSIATVQRRLRRLRSLGIVVQRRSSSDRRTLELTLSAKATRLFARYNKLMTAEVANGNGPMHVCTLCAPSNLSAIATRYLMEGFARGERCVIAGSSRARDAIAEGIGQNRRRACLEIDYAGSMEEQLEIWKLIIADNRGRSLCLIGDAASACAAGMGPDELFEYERRVDPLLRQNKARALCLYDVNAFYGEMLLRALNVHRDCAKYPMPLG